MRSISEARRGKCAGEDNYFYGKKHTAETKQKMAIARRGIYIGERAPRYGMKISEEVKQKISNSLKGKFASAETKLKLSEVRRGPKNHFFGKKFSVLHRQRLSDAHKGKQAGLLNPAWVDGRSNGKYPSEFNELLKEQIKKRDGHICHYPECDSSNYLIVHHIDYEKANCHPDNLIVLCRKHNATVNNNRPYWNNYFAQVINSLRANKEKKVGPCFTAKRD